MAKAKLKKVVKPVSKKTAKKEVKKKTSKPRNQKWSHKTHGKDFTGRYSSHEGSKRVLVLSNKDGKSFQLSSPQKAKKDGWKNK